MLTSGDVELLHASLRDAEKRIALLTQVIEALSQSRDALALLQRSVESVVRTVDASGAFVYLWDEDRGQFVLRVATEGHQRQFVGSIALRPGEGLTGWSALMRRSILIGRDLDQDPRVVTFPELLEEEFLSCLIVPILVPGGDPVGVFSIYSATEDAFTDNDLRLVDEVARLLASGIDRADVVERWERQSAALESLTGLAEAAPRDVPSCLGELVKRVTAIVPSDIAIVETLDVDGRPSESVALSRVRRPVEDDPAARRGDDTGPVEVTATTARSLAKAAFPSLESASIPMRTAERTLGIITVFRASPFDAEDRSLLEAIAGHGALALGGVLHRSSGNAALGQLISARVEEEAVSVLGRFGWQPGMWVTPVVAKCDPEMALAGGRARDTLERAVESVLTARWRRVVSGPPGVVAGMVLSSQQPADDERAQAWIADEVTTALHQHGASAGVAIGIGSASNVPMEIAEQFRRAADAASWVALTSSGVRVADARDIAIPRQIADGTTAVAEDVAMWVAALRRLQDNDTRHRTNLLETLDVFVRERGSVHDASERLFIHRNTLRQRLARIAALIEQPVDGVDDWLPLQLALLIVRR